MVWFGEVRLGEVRWDLVGLGGVRPGLVKYGLVR